MCGLPTASVQHVVGVSPTEEDGELDDLCLPESKSCCRKHKKLAKQGVKLQKKKKMMMIIEITVQLDLKLLHILISTRRLQFLQLNA